VTGSCVLQSSDTVTPTNPTETIIIEATDLPVDETSTTSTSATLSEEELKWIARAEEYPIATEVWLYMKENFGWSDIVCAGVMGNIMGEIGGGTLDFDNWNHPQPYGMFQWLGQRKTDLKNIYGAEPSVVEQLEFMYDELYGTDGVRQQVTNSQREQILNASTPEDVATYFCIYFERPGNSGSPRRGYARKAYNYFVD
jgi:hypothetical protein